MRLIDADALKKAFCEWCGSAASNNPDEVCGRTCGTLDFFDEQPTVEPKRGVWYCCGAYWYECSVCEGTSERMTCFCSSCGARMVGGYENG